MCLSAATMVISLSLISGNLTQGKVSKERLLYSTHLKLAQDGAVLSQERSIQFYVKDKIKVKNLCVD